MDTTEREDRGLKEAQRQGEDKITLHITLIHSNSLNFCFLYWAPPCSPDSNNIVITVPPIESIAHVHGAIICRQELCIHLGSLDLMLRNK